MAAITKFNYVTLSAVDVNVALSLHTVLSPLCQRWINESFIALTVLLFG